MTALCMLTQVSRSALLTATLWWRALLARNIGSYGWGGHLVVFGPPSWRGVGHSRGVSCRQILTTALCMLVQISRIASALWWRTLLARNVGSNRWGGHLVVFTPPS
jgi:predicted DNA-binding transcriptional regulator